MIGDLLKQLVVGLWRFCAYHCRRLLGLRQATHDSAIQPPAPASTEGAAQTSAVGTGLEEPYLRPVRVSTDRDDIIAREILDNPLFQMWKQRVPHAHKWSHYFEVYQTIFSPRRHRAVRMLEIGVFQGQSSRLWKQYFDHPETVIVGIDILPQCAQFDAPSESIHVRIGSQDDPLFLSEVVREFGPFDIIIDDGSHHSSHLIASFNHLFASGLKDDGIYLAEDLHANYWQPYRDSPLTFLDLCKELMELMHAHYTRTSLEDWLRDSVNSVKSHQVTLDVPTISTMIREIRVFDSIVAIQKTRRAHLPRYLNPTTD